MTQHQSTTISKGNSHILRLEELVEGINHTTGPCLQINIWTHTLTYIHFLTMIWLSTDTTAQNDK